MEGSDEKKLSPSPTKEKNGGPTSPETSSLSFDVDTKVLHEHIAMLKQMPLNEKVLV